MIKRYLRQALENIYISPLEGCNLNCRLCYTKKTKNVLSNKEILDFINRYQKSVNLKSVLFCGGEVFKIANFCELINELSQMGIFTTVITNGTIDRLDEIKNPLNCQLLVSLDGPEEIHDQNRGKGNFQKSIDFIKNALSLGSPVEIMFLVTPESYSHKDSFPKILHSLIHPNLPNLPNRLHLTYLTQKASFFTQNHPLAHNQNFPGLSRAQILDIKKNYPSVPPKNFGCVQLSLQSNGLLYGCCESPTAIAKMTDSIENIIENFKKTLATCQKCGQCKGCCRPDFLCGYPREMGASNCQEVVKSFNNRR